MQYTLPIYAINGVINAQVSPLDRGFTYGDGVFETCKMLNTKISLWHLHKERLLVSCEKLRICVDENLIENYLTNLLAQLNIVDTHNAVVKIIVTRGVGGRGYSPTLATTPTIVIGIFPSPQYPNNYFTEGVVLRVCHQRLSCNVGLAGLKHLNRLEQVLARAEWQDETIAEGLMLDINDNVIECVFSNIFLVKNGDLFTPDLSQSGVAGVMRRFIIENIAPKLQLNLTIKTCSLSDVINADEVFICNSHYGIWPVRKLWGDNPQTFKCNEITFKVQTFLTETLSSYAV